MPLPNPQLRLDMNPLDNPYTPAAGTRPPELAGREEILANARVAVKRGKSGRWTRSLMLAGLRGLGKTVLLGEIKDIAGKEGAFTCSLKPDAGKLLSARIIGELRRALLGLSHACDASGKVSRALRALQSFAQASKAKYGGAEFSLELDADGEPGVADTGLLEEDLADLFVAAGEAAKACKSAIVIFIDEIQNMPARELEALIMSAHRTSQKSLPIVIVGAGLPSLMGVLHRIKPYTERLFEYIDIGALNEPEARRALVKPAADLNVTFESKAVTAIIDQTKGHPYFLQEWGYQAWNVARESTIMLADIRKASKAAAICLDQKLFRAHYENLAVPQINYLRAMAELGPGPHRAGDIEAAMGKDPEQLWPTCKALITSGMVYSPRHGMMAFAAPLFDEFIKHQQPKIAGAN